MAIVVAVCALVGALAGIAGSAAAPSKSKAQAQAAKKQAMRQARKFRQAFRMHGGFGFRHGPGPGMLMGGPVHAEAVVPKPDGSGFITVTTDSGTLNGVDGTTVDVKDGTDKATYEDSVKIDVGSDAVVIRDGKKATLADLQAGDHVRVIQGPKRNAVFAADAAFIAQQQKEHQGWDHHGFGPGGPPPGAPGGYPGDPQGGQNQNGSDSGSSSGGGNS